MTMATACNQSLVFDPANHLKIGLIALSTDLSVERDFYMMKPSQAVEIFVNRVEFINPTTKANLMAMQPKITQAAEIILPSIKLDSIVYACTSASAVIGDETVRESVSKGKPGTPVVTPTTGAVSAFKQMGIDNIALLAPYIKSVSESLAEYFCKQGLNIKTLSYLGIEDDRDIGRLCQQSIIEAASKMIEPNTTGIFLACTALQAVPIIEELELKLGIPVVSSNQAMFWQAIRTCGYDQPINGFGKLLTKH